jgi:hypothetical protein
MSGRTRWQRPDGEWVTGYRKTDRRNPRGQHGSEAPDLKLILMLPKDVMVSPGRHGVGVEVTDLGNVAITAKTFNRAHLFSLASGFLAIVARGHVPFSCAALLTSSFEPGWKMAWHITFIDGHVIAAITPVDPLIFARS